jgi:hypothetical protein
MDGPLTFLGGDARIRTGDKGFAGLCLATWRRRLRRPSRALSRTKAGSVSAYFRYQPSRGIYGADDGIRTRDPNLGKVVLYQLSHVRMRKAQAVGYQRGTGRATAGSGERGGRTGPVDANVGGSGAPSRGWYNTPRCAPPRRLRTTARALSSGGEHFLDAEGVVGSNPTAPTRTDRRPRLG